ncbi:MAG: DNA polymerase III subunit gamma/tau [Bacteroidales bacterium]|nr:DNA polymerase III subunit gamma/tau [Bacteroidales bacterium]
MEKFIVSARKYRPDTFDTVVGQQSITVTLKNAISTNHLAHAYLFCGPRGVGKTTCARIFAKTINCLNLKSNIEACNECASCKSFNESRAFNIHELDAASNNSVDDIRNLIDQVRIPPQIGKYSIYIIDEVHMLSQQAFNAFLKTLEEPPAHAIFILATTEKHKIIPTILSRCQIFDFNRITIEDITGYLEKIAKSEHIAYEPDALNVIAQKADGGMRDALSIFDMMASFTGNEITYKKVIDNLNVLDYNYYFRIIELFLSGNVGEVLLMFDKILKEGFDAQNFLSGLSKHFRDLLVCKDEKTLILLEVGSSIQQLYKSQAAVTSVDFLFRALEITNECDLSFKASRNQRLHVELALIKLCSIADEKKNLKNSDEGEKEQVAPEQAPRIKKEQPIAAPQQVAEPVTPIEVKKPQYKSQVSVSIKDALKKFDLPVSENHEDNVNGEGLTNDDEVAGVRESPFTQDDLLNAWSEYAEKIRESMPRSFSTLKTQVPVLKEGYIAEVTLLNQAQADDFNQRIKGELLAYLRENLKNNLLTFDIRIPEEPQTNGRRPYTAEEKFRYMADKNPLLLKLKQEFNLDFE